MKINVFRSSNGGLNVVLLFFSRVLLTPILKSDVGQFVEIASDSLRLLVRDALVSDGFLTFSMLNISVRLGLLVDVLGFNVVLAL